MISLKNIAQEARVALEEEVSVWPKPGLVTPLDTGAHDDMDWFSFMASAEALEPYFLEVLRLGMRSYGCDSANLWKQLRPLGIWGEELMRDATSGVNTHKGALFSLGLLCCAIGRLLAQKKSLTPDQIMFEVTKLVQGIVARELVPLSSNPPLKLTAGQRFYLEHGFTGIRGEAERGFPSVLAALGFWKSLGGKLSRREQLAQTLLFLMTFAEDTNVLSRCGLEGLLELRALSRDALKLGGLASEEGKRAVAMMERRFVTHRLSPGGCADLLALAIFLDSLASTEMKNRS